MNKNWLNELKEYKRTEFVRTRHFCFSADFVSIGLCVVIGIVHPLLYIRLLNLELRLF